MIRKATTNDIESIQQMAEVTFRATYERILSPDQIDYMMNWMYSADSLNHQINDEGKCFFVAQDDNDDYMGYISVEREGDTADNRPLVHLQKIYVMPQHQGKGLGKSLFAHVKKYLHETYPSGCRVELNVNRNNKAVDFYEKMGMHKDRQGDFPIGNGYYMNDYIYAIDL